MYPYQHDPFTGHQLRTPSRPFYHSDFDPFNQRVHQWKPRTSGRVYFGKIALIILAATAILWIL